MTSVENFAVMLRGIREACQGRSRPRKLVGLGGLLSLLVLSPATGQSVPGEQPHASREAPFSESAIPAEATRRAVATGLEHLVLARGEASDSTGYRLLVGTFSSQSEASEVLGRLGALDIDAFPESGGGVYSVVAASSATRGGAEELKDRLLAHGFSEPLQIQEITHDPNAAAGPWKINVLLADPRAIDVRVTHSSDAAIGLETTRELAVRKGALAAINGGYFRMTGTLAGDSQGVLQIDGVLLSEPDRGRGAVGFFDVDGATRAVFGRPAFRGDVRAGAAGGDEVVVAIDGINRGRGPDEIVLFTPEFHRTTLTDPGGTEVVIEGGRISEIFSGAGSSEIPHDGVVLSISPGRAGDLVPRLRPTGDGAVDISVDLRLLSLLPDTEGRWARAEDVLGGGPLLLKDGERLEEPAEESISAAFYYARHPRTAAGVRADGTFVFVTVDGRQPGVSVGMSIPELTDLMLDLGCVSAVNLDGGGSTTMVIDGEIVNAPSSSSGPRRNGDALLLFAKEN